MPGDDSVTIDVYMAGGGCNAAWQGHGGCRARATKRGPEFVFDVITRAASTAAAVVGVGCPPGRNGGLPVQKANPAGNSTAPQRKSGADKDLLTDGLNELGPSRRA